jgi:16S rRNA (cytosine1402-N4)-methyltransferase
MFSKVLDSSSARWLAKRVLERREIKPIKTVGDFLDICEGLRGKARLNTATLPMLALRIAVNSELENLKEALPKAGDLLGAEGKLLVITFHSGEEEIVKSFSNDFVGPIKPTMEEIEKNPRARSAELFVLTKKC